MARRVPTLDVRPVDLMGMRRPFVLSIVQLNGRIELNGGQLCGSSKLPAVCPAH
jgi:hypothetical protein